MRFYRPLEADDQIRLLKLEASSETGSLRCTIEHVFLSDNPQYDALSYAWGKPHFTRTIQAEGNAMKITENLHAALSQFCRSGHSRRLWVDAICINQSENLEKNHQVKMMGRIYAQAKNVIIWLGLEDSTSKDAMRFTRRVAAVMERHFDTDWNDSAFVVNLSRPRNLAAFRKDFEHIFKAAEWTSLRKLFDRAWFSRRWVVQEAILAQRATVYCGSSKISWPKFLSAITVLQLYRYTHTIKLDGGNNTAPTTVLHEGWTRTSAWRPVKDNRKHPMTHPFLRFAGFECEDSRDYIFALLSLINLDQTTPFEPDYAKDAASVYKDFASHCLRHSKTLSVLNFAGNLSSSDSDRLHLPSWVPNWHANPLESPFLLGGRQSRFAAGSADGPTVRVDDDSRTLHIDGLLLSKINTSSCMPRNSRISFDLYQTRFSEWRDLMQSQSDKGTYTTGEGFVKALARTLVADEVFPITRLGLSAIFTGDDSSWALDGVKRLFFEFHESLLSITNPSDVLQSLVPKFERDSMSNAIDYLFASYVILEGRSFIVTESGHIGIGPENAKKGDLVAIFKGGETPFILRPLDKMLSRLIGECYVHGAMYGEVWNTEASSTLEKFVIQ